MKEIGCSGRFASESRSVFAGTAMLPLSFDSTFRVVVMVVSISLAESVSSLLLISNKKQSRIGIVLLEFRTPPMDLRYFNKVEADTTKFIQLILVSEITGTKGITLDKRAEF